MHRGHPGEFLVELSTIEPSPLSIRSSRPPLLPCTWCPPFHPWNSLEESSSQLAYRLSFAIARGLLNAEPNLEVREHQEMQSGTDRAGRQLEAVRQLQTPGFSGSSRTLLEREEIPWR